MPCPLPRPLSDSGRTRLLAACKASRDRRLYPLVVLALSTGARQPELLALCWSDIEFEQARATFRESKSDERRVLALNDKALAVLRELHRGRETQSDLVFATNSGEIKVPRMAWEVALRQARIGNYHFHDLRRIADRVAHSSGEI